MEDREALNKLRHAMLWLRSERSAPAWTTAGVYYALRKLSEATGTFYVNRPHRSNRCTRCNEIAAIAAINADTQQEAR